MKTTEAIKTIMKEQGVSQGVMAKRLSLKSNQVINERLHQDTISFKKANEMLKVLGYKIVLMPIDKRLPDNSYEVE